MLGKVRLWLSLTIVIANPWERNPSEELIHTSLLEQRAVAAELAGAKTMKSLGAACAACVCCVVLYAFCVKNCTWKNCNVRQCPGMANLLLQIGWDEFHDVKILVEILAVQDAIKSGISIGEKMVKGIF